MTMVVEKCPLCGGQDHGPFERHEEAGHALQYRLCRTCGLMLQSPRMSDEELAAFYTSSYRLTVQGTEAPTEKDLRMQAGRARHLVRFSQGRLPAVARHLDIGCSSGALLRAFSRSYGCESVGVEPGQAYRAVAASRGTRAVASLDDLDDMQAATFDLVSLVHVLEHIADPVAYLRRLREERLSPGGTLLVEVPNLFGHKGVELSHLAVYAPRTLCQVLQASGFRVLKMRTHGVPRSPILRLYVTALARRLPEGAGEPRIRFSGRGVRARRRIGLWLNETMTRRLPNWTWQEWPEPEDSGT